MGDPGFNYCPSCGVGLEFKANESQDDVATFHEKAECPKCGGRWEITWEKGYHLKLLNISPIYDE